jgi:hypothetical protein
MNEEEQRLEDEKVAAEAKAKDELKQKSVDELTELLHTTRSEAKTRRLRERELESKLAEMEAGIKAKSDAKLLEDGKIQELLDANILELTSTKDELDKVKIVAEESTNFKAAQVEIYKKAMGTKWVDEYANLSLTALDTLVNNAIPKKIGTDDGVDAEHQGVVLTDDQKREAEAKYPHISKEKAWEYHIDNLIKSGKIKEK